MIDRRALNAGTAAVFVVSFFAFAFFFLRLPILVDADSYYHLAVARLYGQEGIAATVPWARFSLLASGADKEYLFHLLLIPFASWGDAAIGGRLALATLNAALAAVVARYAAAAIGPAGFAFPLWLWIAAPPFFARAVRLRPELLALLIILLAIGAAARRRYVALGLLSFAFALGYTAFHVFFALVVMWAVVGCRLSVVRPPHPDNGQRTTDNRLLSSSALGILAGLLLRPHLLANLRLWYVQNVEFFRWADRLDVGNEIRPPSLYTLWTSIAFVIGLAMIAGAAWRTRRTGSPAVETPYAAIAAAMFALLFVRFGRMATYVYPLAALAVILWAGERVRRMAPVALAATLVLAIPLARDPMLMQLLTQNVVTEAELDRFGQAVPPGAKVAATWGDGETYAFWAPQGRYLNVLEPLFMMAVNPRAYEAQRRVFSGQEPDVAGVVRRELDSDFLAFDATSAPPALIERVRRDPRLRLRYAGANLLFEVH